MDCVNTDIFVGVAERLPTHSRVTILLKTLSVGVLLALQNWKEVKRMEIEEIGLLTELSWCVSIVDW